MNGADSSAQLADLIGMTGLRRITAWILLFTIVMLMAPLLAVADNTKSEIDHFSSLRTRLVEDKFDQKQITRLYQQPEVKFDLKNVSLYFVHSEGKLNYDQFLQANLIEKAKNYMKAHDKHLEKAEKAYGVDREIITAIFLVETRLGTYLGSRSVFNVLSTMAALDDSQVRDDFWKKIRKKSRLTTKAFNTKAERKSAWAYNELKAFLTYTSKEKLDPTKIKGSYAGAIGICQFIPSSILRLATDGNQDGAINLFDHADAIMSVANYLKHHGWHQNIKKKKAYRVIHAYNRSKYYVKTVLKAGDLLKGK